MPQLLKRLGRNAVGRLSLATAAFVLGAIPYPYLNAWLEPRFDFMTSLDRAIPFVPWTLAVYACWLLLPALAVVALEGSELFRLLAGLLACAALCYAGFALFTAHFPRPSLEELGGSVWRGAYEWLHGVDGPGNTFPSLHVALTAFAALRMRRHRLGAMWVGAAILISLSTLTTRQHFVADVAAGAVLASLVHLAIPRREADRR
ncbi:MAG: phosphatase PAP2 family protein [Deltaproteobacteria bacterium]|nr:phosphatase PAP2 family protein [Deltaproteobacteria bacterium]